MRVPSLDVLKGVLIFFVMLSHMIRAEAQDSFLQYFINSFTIPLFFGLSGYLFNFEKLQQQPKKSMGALLKGIVLPWLIVTILYACAVNYQKISDFPLFFQGIGKALVYAYFHLWYVPGYLSYIFLLYLMIVLRFHDIVKIIASITVSIFVLYFYVFAKNAPFAFQAFLNNFRMYNFLFFVFGYILNKHQKYLKLSPFNITIVSFLFVFNTMVCYFLQFNVYLHHTLKLILFYGANLLLIAFVLSLCVNFPSVKSRVLKKLEAWGRDSLFIYLYHAAPIILLRHLMPVAGFFYYFMNVASISLLLFMLRFSRRFGFLRFISWM